MNMWWPIVDTKPKRVSGPIKHKTIIPYKAVYVPRMRQVMNGSNFLIVQSILRHNLNKHWACFHAVTQITTIMIDTVNPLLAIKIEE